MSEPEPKRSGLRRPKGRSPLARREPEAMPLAAYDTLNGESAAFEDRYTGVGAQLRSERQRLGASVDDIADRLRIQARYLVALEEGRHDELPAAAYAIGFLRSYAALLGLDPQGVVDAFKQETAVAPAERPLVFPQPLDTGRRTLGPWTLAVVLILAVGYGLWSLLQANGEQVLELVPAPPERLQALLQGPQESPPTVPGVATPSPVRAPSDTPPGTGRATDESAGAADTTGSSGPSAAAAGDIGGARAEGASAEPPAPPSAVGSTHKTTPGSPARTDAAADSPPDEAAAVSARTNLAAAPSTVEPRPAGLSESAPPESEIAAPEETAALSGPPEIPTTAGAAGYAPQSYGAADGPGRVVVRATADAWVQVKDPRGDVLLTRILRPGDSYYAPSRADVVMMTGNAGGIEILVDGRPIGPLGPDGAVRRDIPLHPEKLLEGWHGR